MFLFAITTTDFIKLMGGLLFQDGGGNVFKYSHYFIFNVITQPF